MTKASPAPLWRSVLRRALSPIVTLIAVIYFLIDAITLAIVHPVAQWVAGWPMFGHMGRWLRSLPPYPSLALFLVPLVVLEPAKPLGAWYLASGHAVKGVAVFAGAELLKIALVERLFHMNRDKLLSIPAFAWCYVRMVALVDRLKALPPWQAVLRVARRIRRSTRRLVVLLRRQH